MPKASILSTADSIDEVRGIRPVLPVFVRHGSQYAFFYGDLSLETVKAEGVASKKLPNRIAGVMADAGDVAVNVTDGTEAMVTGCDERGVILDRDIFNAGDTYRVGTVNDGKYLTSTVPGYRPGENKSGRWIAAHCYGCSH